MTTELESLFGPWVGLKRFRLLKLLGVPWEREILNLTGGTLSSAK